MTVRVLNSWKEIASYLNRGVRTVQRWERDLNLPVRRPRGKQRSAVIALADDLDNWLKHTPLPEMNDKPRRADLNQLVASRDRLHASAQKLLVQTSALNLNLKHAYELCQAMTARRQKRDGDRAERRISG